MSAQQKVIVSISGSVIGHMLLLLLVFFVLTASRESDSDSGAKEKEKKKGPKEITVMMPDLMKQIEAVQPKPKPIVPKQKQFVSTDSISRASTKPENAQFESDRNTVAATEVLPDPNAPQVSGVTMRGEAWMRSLELQNQRYLDGKPDEAPGATKKQVKNENVFTDKDSLSDSRVMKTKFKQTNDATDTELDSTTNGAAVAKKKSSANGTLTNKGKSSVDAAATPLGQYKKSVIDAIAEKWHQFRKENDKSVTWGTLRLTFNVDSEGKVSKLVVSENKGNDTLLDLTLKSISESKLPSMPEEVSKALGESGLVMKYDVIIY